MRRGVAGAGAEARLQLRAARAALRRARHVHLRRLPAHRRKPVALRLDALRQQGRPRVGERARQPRRSPQGGAHALRHGAAVRRLVAADTRAQRRTGLRRAGAADAQRHPAASPALVRHVAGARKLVHQPRVLLHHESQLQECHQVGAGQAVRLAAVSGRTPSHARLMSRLREHERHDDQQQLDDAQSRLHETGAETAARCRHVDVDAAGSSGERRKWPHSLPNGRRIAMSVRRSSAYVVNRQNYRFITDAHGKDVSALNAGNDIQREIPVLVHSVCHYIWNVR